MRVESSCDETGVALVRGNELLVDEVWGGSPPATVAKSVQVYVSRLRSKLEPAGIKIRTVRGFLDRIGHSTGINSYGRK